MRNFKNIPTIPYFEIPKHFLLLIVYKILTELLW